MSLTSLVVRYTPNRISTKHFAFVEGPLGAKLSLLADDHHACVRSTAPVRMTPITITQLPAPASRAIESHPVGYHHRPERPPEMRHKQQGATAGQITHKDYVQKDADNALQLAFQKACQELVS